MTKCLWKSDDLLRRWTYKYGNRREKGAAAAVIIHETEPAAYPYSVAGKRVGRARITDRGVRIKTHRGRR